MVYNKFKWIPISSFLYKVGIVHFYISRGLGLINFKIEIYYLGKQRIQILMKCCIVWHHRSRYGNFMSMKDEK